MFAEIHKKRMEKWENVVTESLLESFKNEGWENVYFDEINETDFGKNIDIIKISDIYSMARRMINNKSVNREIKPGRVLKNKVNNILHIYDYENKKRIRQKVGTEYDLVFLKTIIRKRRGWKKKTDEDPLRAWCQQFLKSYSNEEPETINSAIENVPEYKPTQSQIQKLQKKREKELLKWGSQF